MRSRGKHDKSADRPTQRQSTSLGVELVACEVGQQLITIDCVAVDESARGWPFMLPLVRPLDHTVIDTALTLMRWVERAERVEMTTYADEGGGPARVVLEAGRFHLELVAACEGSFISR